MANYKIPKFPFTRQTPCTDNVKPVFREATVQTSAEAFTSTGVTINPSIIKSAGKISTPVCNLNPEHLDAWVNGHY